MKNGHIIHFYEIFKIYFEIFQKYIYIVYVKQIKQQLIKTNKTMDYKVGMRIYKIGDYEMGMVLGIYTATVVKINGDRIYCESDPTKRLFGAPNKRFWFKNKNGYVPTWKELTDEVIQEVDNNIKKYNEVMSRCNH